jgi:hypothetical protein
VDGVTAAALRPSGWFWRQEYGDAVKRAVAGGWAGTRCGGAGGTVGGG